MKKTITKLMAALALLLFVAPPLVGWGQTSNEVTYTFSQHYNANTTLTDVAIAFDDNITATFHKGSGSTAPQYYTNGTAVRWYGGNTLDITATNATISAIEFTYTQKNKDVTANVGEYNHDEGTWTGSESSVTFTVASGSGHNRVSEIKVTYTTSGGTPAPSITANNVEIAYDATEGAIEYTINNGIDGGVLSAATEAEWINIGIVGETVPFTCEVNPDGERTATVTLTYTYDTDQTVTKNVTVTQANNPNAPGTEGNPYTVAQARAAIDAGTGTQGVYATGIVSEIVTEYSSQYSNITFDIVDEEGDEVFLRAYRCGGEEAPNVAVGDVVVVYGNLILYNNSLYEFAQGCQVVSLEHPVITDPYITAENVNIEFDATSGSIAYEIGNPVNDGVLTASVPEESWITLGDDFTSPIAFTCSANQASSPRTETVTLTYTYGESNITMDVTVTQAAAPQPSLTVTPATVNAPVEGADGTLAITYENIPELISFDYYFCDAEGNELQETPDWIDAEIQEENENYSVYYFIDANEGEARTAYFKVYTLVGDEEVYSMVTVNQEAYVAPTYADLPFAFNDGKADIEGTDGLYQEGLGSDYNANNNPTTKLKFDTTDDWLLLQFTERPGTLTFDIKGNSFSGGTFKVQTSEDGETFTDFAVYNDDNLTNTVQNEEFTTLGENVRYIKWVYTEKSNGNVGLGNIALAEYAEPVIVASITVDPDVVELDANEHDGTLDLAYENLTITNMDDFGIQYYDAQGEETSEPDWIEVLVAEQDPQIGEGYVVSYFMLENEGEARSAYFKVFAAGDEDFVYSNLVTINQDAYEAPVASITFDPDSLIFDAELHYDGALPFTYENIIVDSIQSFGLQFYTAEGEETGMPEWFFAMVTPRSNENNGEYQVSCAIMANEGEARSVYFKVYAFDADSIPVYSNLATVTQTAPVYDYAILPFVWEGGSSADFLALNGVTANGLGNDYASGNAPYLIKFDGTGDYIQVKTDSQPGMVTINVKMIGGSNTSTITIQGSDDGETFTDIQELTISGSQNDELTLETTNAFGANDRYVRMLFTKGSNVGVGPITITKGTVPSITVTPDIFELEAVGPLNGMHLPSMMVYCHNLEIAQASDFNYQFYNAEGEEQEMPEWILHSEVSLITETGYQAICIVTANDGPARSAYFKVYALDADSIPVYSNLVTINQEAAPIAAYYNYSINGVDGQINMAEVDTPVTLANGEDLNADFTFAGWTTNPNDVENRITEYTFSEYESVTFYAVYEHTTTIGSTVTRDGASYVKVTSTDDLEDGNYLIVYEEGGVAFNGSLETLDDTENTVEVTIDNDVIAANNDVNGAAFTIAAIDGGYSIMSMSGKYIGQTSNNNGMVAGENVITNTISIDGEDADIVSSSAHLRYNSANNQLRFRYYKSSSYTNQQAIQLYKYTTGETPTPTPQPVTETNYYTRVFFTTEMVTSDIEIIGPSIVPSGNQLDMFSALGSYAIINDNPANLIIEGEVLSGEIQFNGTMLKNITACDYNENNSAGYYLIASPIDNFVPSIDNGFITDQYDLYAYNATQDLEWINFKDESNNFTSLQSNKGYLYANGVNTTLKFAGLLTGSYHTIIENLDYADGDNEAKRLTLIGNSSTYDLKCEVENSQYQSVTTNFLTLNESGDGFIVSESNYYNAEPMESFFVYAYEGGLRVLAYNSTLGYPWGGNVGGDPVPGGGGLAPDGPFGCINPNSHLNITVSGTVSGQRGNALLDNAIVSFGEGTTMKKLYLSEYSTRVYIPQSNNDYAVVRSAAQGEMPVNFKASKNGSYTLAIDAENVEMNYLHLIDNMTGADVDLLATPSYTFDAKTSDYASRFKLVFSANANENDDENETFAFFNGSEWCISNTGEATLQVVDMLGRIVSSESVNGNATLSTDNLMSGVYMFRLVNGENVKVQKVVVK